MNLALNPFDKGKKPEKIEAVELDSLDDKILDMVKVYEENAKYGYAHLNYCLNHEVKYPVLTPSEIDIALQLALRIKTQGVDYLTGPFFSKLVQLSFDAGYNDFKLHLEGTTKSHIGYKVRGREDKILKCEVFGDINVNGFKEAIYCDAKIHGDVGFMFGHSSRHCTFEIDGNIDKLDTIRQHHNTYLVNEDMYNKVRRWLGVSNTVIIKE
ncbi:hypothetical protein KY330_05845 [Candidatus Woesearchaeota archaeon]|nr:hypothetical protein [Candidatus Woesearchaeota archaeon]